MFTPPLFGLHARLVPTLKVLVLPALCLGQSRNRQVPRAPLPASGVTSGGEISCTSSEGVTPLSSLMRTHAPDQNPPADFGFPIRPVFAGCRQSLLEDGPSRRYLHNLCKGARTHTPPRSRRSHPFGRPTPWFRTLRPQDFGLTLVSTGSAREKFPAMQLQQGGYFGAAVIR